MVLFAGASETYKRWSWEKFAKLALQIVQKHDLEIKIVGSKTELKIADLMVDFFKNHNANTSNLIHYQNLTAKTSLLELSQLIAASYLLLTNETVAVHLAVATQSKAICIANGRHFGRFSPYPKNYKTKTRYIFPPEIEKIRADEDKTALKYCNSAGLNIDSIEMETVLEKVEQLLI